MLRAISFDLGWTLAHPADSIWSIYARLCTEAGAPRSAVDCEHLARSLWGAAQERALERFRGGAMYSDSDEEFVALFSPTSDLMFGEAGLKHRGADLSEQFLEEFWNHERWQAFPDTIATIRELRASGFSVGVVSNAPSDLPRMLEALELSVHLDFTVVSAIEGTKKPDRRIFERALEQAGVAPEEMLHVGDLYLEDVLGAGAVGVRAMLIERGERSLFPSFPESAGRELPGGTVVHSLEEVLRLLTGQDV